jgi:hypothetical protein
MSSYDDWKQDSDGVVKDWTVDTASGSSGVITEDAADPSVTACVLRFTGSASAPEVECIRDGVTTGGRLHDCGISDFACEKYEDEKVIGTVGSRPFEIALTAPRALQCDISEPPEGDDSHDDPGAGSWTALDGAGLNEQPTAVDARRGRRPLAAVALSRTPEVGALR